MSCATLIFYSSKSIFVVINRIQRRSPFHSRCEALDEFSVFAATHLRCVIICLHCSRVAVLGMTTEST
uniref:Uncharacterized protein n=1 Tax=Anguilla anguilla TaxID=7936 RepID=A0A0E9XGM5_ANGAN